MSRIDVLDKGYVQLIEHMGSDQSIVDSARVSYASTKKRRPPGTLIHYLMKNGHTSPFEQVVFRFEVKAPLFVIAQWQRHRTWSYNQISARYSEMEDEFYSPSPNAIRGQSTGPNKQVGDGLLSSELQADSSALIQYTAEECYTTYKVLLNNGVAREQARMVLSTNLYTKMVAKVDLHNLFKFLKERTASSAQYEIQVYAEAILSLITPIVPIAVNAWLTR